MTSIAVLKSWFETGDTPTEAQFAELIDSLYHKSENIPINKVQDLVSELNEIHELLESVGGGSSGSGVIIWNEETIPEGGYAKDSMVSYGDVIYRSEVNENIDTPGNLDDDKWIPQSSEKGLIDELTTVVTNIQNTVSNIQTQQIALKIFMKSNY